MDSNERTMGMLCHLLAFSGFIGVPVGNIVGPLVIWLIKKDSSAFVDEQGKSSLNFQISYTIYAAALTVVCFIVGLVTCGVGWLILIPAALLLSIAELVFVIQASIEANNGRTYRYPYSITFIS